MLIVGTFLILVLLVLAQVNILALNLALVALCALFLFSKRDFSFWWLFVTAILLALFTNLNPGLVIVAFTLTFLLMDLFSRIFPDNRLVKGLLLIMVLFVSEYSLITLGKILE